MDGRYWCPIRQALESSKVYVYTLHQLAYSAKICLELITVPFRDAVGSGGNIKGGNKKKLSIGIGLFPMNDA